jgi:hypothetical protein
VAGVKLSVRAGMEIGGLVQLVLQLYIISVPGLLERVL